MQMPLQRGPCSQSWKLFQKAMVSIFLCNNRCSCLLRYHDSELSWEIHKVKQELGWFNVQLDRSLMIFPSLCIDLQALDGDNSVYLHGKHSPVDFCRPNNFYKSRQNWIFFSRYSPMGSQQPSLWPHLRAAKFPSVAGDHQLSRDDSPPSARACQGGSMSRLCMILCKMAPN